MRIWRRRGLIITAVVIDHAIMKWEMMFCVPLDTCGTLRCLWKAWSFLTSVFDSRWRPLWLWALGRWSESLTLLIACIGSFGSSGADAFRSALHFKNSVLPKPRAGEYECLLINGCCVSHWDMNSTRAAREPDIEANPRSPLQAWY